METSKCQKCNSDKTPYEDQCSWECGTRQSLIGGSHFRTPKFKLIESEHCRCRQELARLKSEKEAAETERDEARLQRDRLAGSLVGAIVDYDHQPYQVGDEDYERLCRRPEDGRYVLDAKAVDDIAQVEQWEEAVTWRNLVEQLTAATSRAEALATGIESIHSGRIVLSQADNKEWGAVLGTRIVTGCETAAEAVLAALLPPAKEVDGGK